MIQSDENWRSRTGLLLGEEKLERLQHSHVLVAGLGGVGAFAAEQLCRAGVGKLTIVDGDSVAPSNRNRQLLALASTQGQRKAQLMAMRLRDINPDVELVVVDEFIKDQRTNELLSHPYDYVIDAIDTLSPKVFFILAALRNNLPLVSSMGAGGKLNPAMITVADISETSGCKLAFYIRKRLQRFGVKEGFQAVFSPETVDKSAVKPVDDEPNKKTTVGTISYMPAMFGCYCASVALRQLIEK
ncbi:MAG TPA: tRNA threonylcarbamoyladenosine dehydratase [Bacteroidales bacterium]|nr:tRNA threonylcarbamoyladenosine dehydratase [Bacteroidales bacterium]